MEGEKLRGIPEFIEKKNRTEQERPELTAEQRLITIDGVDGSGKSGLAKYLVHNLQEIYGEDLVVLVDATNLKGSPQQERLKERSDQGNLSKDIMDKVYAAGVNRAYDDLIVPALDAGKIVVVDRSEVDLLRYAILSGNEKIIQDRKKYIEDGTLTHRYWSGNRISLKVSPKDVWKNIKNRKKNSPHDPQSEEHVRAFIEAEEIAEKGITEVKHAGNVHYMNIENPRVENENKVDEHLDSLAKNITQQLKIEGIKKREVNLPA